MNTKTAPAYEGAYDDLRLVQPARSVPAGAGWDWIAGGWKLFMGAPLMWIIAIIIVFIASIAMSLVPILGGIAVQLLQPVVTAGFMVGSHSVDRGGNFELEHLFAGFKKNFGSLVVVGLLFVIGGIAILLGFVAIVAMTVGTAILTGGLGANPPAPLASAPLIPVGRLLLLAPLLPPFSAYLVAPPLVRK